MHNCHRQWRREEQFAPPGLAQNLKQLARDRKNSGPRRAEAQWLFCIHRRYSVTPAVGMSALCQ